MAQNILNPTTSRVVYSDDARVIAGGERIHNVTPDDTTRRAVVRGDLILEDEGVVETPNTEPAALGEPVPEDGH